jgi:hypothetical protein
MYEYSIQEQGCENISFYLSNPGSKEENKSTIEKVLSSSRVFRLFDADGNRVASGKLYSDNICDNEFIPLDGYGESVGATSIEYLESGKWVEL